MINIFHVDNIIAFDKSAQAKFIAFGNIDGVMIYNMNINEIIWNNVSALMKKKYGKENLYKTSSESKGSISLGALQRIKGQKTSIGVDVLAAIADFFEIQVWHLLLFNLDVENPPVILLTEAEQQFYQRMKDASKQLTLTENT